MSKSFLAILVIVVGVMIGVFIATRDNSDNSGNQSQATTSSHHQGAGKKGIELIEYGDLQCPACKAYEPIVKEVVAHYGDDIKFTFRHFPLTQIHPHAMLAARAAEAAGKQGKFWEYHDILYERQETWSQMSNPSSVFDEYARELGLNLKKFKADKASKAVADTANADLAAARAIGASATPTFVLNGEPLQPTPRTPAEFIEIIDSEIDRRGDTKPN